MTLARTIASLDAISRDRALTHAESRALEKALREQNWSAYEIATGPARAAVGTFPYPHRSCAEWR